MIYQFLFINPWYLQRFKDFESIKVFGLKGNKIKEINNSNENTYFINIYNDNNYSNNYIITGNEGYVKSYNYEKNKIYYKYYDNNNLEPHSSIVINEKKDIVELIESCFDGIIRIWNFHSGELLNKLFVDSNCLYGICLWNNEYLFVGCRNRTIKLIDLNERLIKSEFKGHNNYVLTIKKVIHPKYGECLISQGYDDGIKLWINNK